MLIIQKTVGKDKRFLHRDLTVDNTYYYVWKQEKEGAYGVNSRKEGKELLNQIAPNVSNKLISFRPL